MRFMMMVKHPENHSGPPPKALTDAMDQIMQEAVNNGTMVMAGGLASTAQSNRVRLSGGKISVIDGPFTETKEVVGGFAIMDFKSKEEALEAAKHFIDLHRQHWPGWEGESEVRQMYGPEEFPPKA
ncbi:MAG TPA: YciI family protein [Candidatus Dormibacteraeota bacterium]|nr:YciI family protein [Candidatus Dormibacteraeota bacterium]